MGYNCPYCNKPLIISIDAKIELKKKEVPAMPNETKNYMENYMLDFIPDINHERIQAYLVKINSWLKDRLTRVKLPDGHILERPFSKFLYDLCAEHKISQIYVLALIQKEQSALFRSEPPSDKVQNKIVGYAITESGKIPGFDGFEMQFISAIKQLRRYDKWEQVIKLQEVSLYDDSEDKADLKAKGITFTGKYKPQNTVEAKSMLYTPRLFPLIQMGELYNKIAKEI